MNDDINKWVLITGGAKRIGARIARTLHAQDMNLVIHFNTSSDDANELCSELNSIRNDSAIAIGANLTNPDEVESLIKKVIERTGQLDVLINNASTFYPTPIEDITLDDWDNLVGTNLKAPLFLCKYAAPHIKKSKGSIINMVDIHASKPLKKHPIYGHAKSGLVMLTRSLAKDLAPEVRVNGIAPGMILWPENEPPEEIKQKVVNQIPLKRSGEPNDIAKTVLFLIADADYITGQIIAVDGGRGISS
ncbi:MAG: pteridine reductase [Gammaproteobacteria bacterium]|nr:pteridine reductase [Gammaproteobacteria bacterium]